MADEVEFNIEGDEQLIKSLNEMQNVTSAGFHGKMNEYQFIEKCKEIIKKHETD